MAIKQYSYLQNNALPLNGRVGSNLAILDAVLADGFSSVDITSITIADGVATVVTTTAHSFVEGDLVVISGCTLLSVGLNAEWTVSAAPADNTHFTFVTSETESATGAPAAKIAPLGFGKAYTGTNKRIYRPASGKRDYLRVDDTNAAYSLVRAATSYSGIDTMNGTAFPTVANSTSGYVWRKDEAAAAVAITATSVVVAGGVATVTTPTAHGLSRRNRTTISGATAGYTGLNGVQYVASVVSPTVFTFTTLVGNGTASGTIVTTKYANKKWFLFGNATGFVFLTERYNDVFDLYLFGEVSPLRGGSAASILGGLKVVAGGYAVAGDAALELGTLGTYDTENGTNLLGAAVETPAIVKDSNRAVPGLRSEDMLSEVFLSDTVTVENPASVTTTRKAAVRGLFAPMTESLYAFANNTAVSMKPEGYPTASLKAFKVVGGGNSTRNFITNVFVNLLNWT